MAAPGNPLSPGGPGRPEFALPMPPPLLHHRSGHEIYDGPNTPTQIGFTSPFSTPQGSPSKNRIPPGANDLPNVFENAMTLSPGSPSKSGRERLSLHSPNKNGRQVMGEDIDENESHQGYFTGPGSPTRKLKDENTPPYTRQGKEASYTPTQAAISRQEPYQTRETIDPAPRGRYNPQRGLTPEELEKLQLPKVKRLANVTQLCRVQSDLLRFQRLMAY